MSTKTERYFEHVHAQCGFPHFECRPLEKVQETFKGGNMRPQKAPELKRTLFALSSSRFVVNWPPRVDVAREQGAFVAHDEQPVFRAGNGDVHAGLWNRSP